MVVPVVGDTDVFAVEVDARLIRADSELRVAARSVDVVGVGASLARRREPAAVGAMAGGVRAGRDARRPVNRGVLARAVRVRRISWTPGTGRAGRDFPGRAHDRVGRLRRPGCGKKRGVESRGGGRRRPGRPRRAAAGRGAPCRRDSFACAARFSDPDERRGRQDHRGSTKEIRRAGRARPGRRDGCRRLSPDRRRRREGPA